MQALTQTSRVQEELDHTAKSKAVKRQLIPSSLEALPSMEPLPSGTNKPKPSTKGADVLASSGLRNPLVSALLSANNYVNQMTVIGYDPLQIHKLHIFCAFNYYSAETLDT